MELNTGLNESTYYITYHVLMGVDGAHNTIQTDTEFAFFRLRFKKTH